MDIATTPPKTAVNYWCFSNLSLSLAQLIYQGYWVWEMLEYIFFLSILYQLECRPPLFFYIYSRGIKTSGKRQGRQTSQGKKKIKKEKEKTKIIKRQRDKRGVWVILPMSVSQYRDERVSYHIRSRQFVLHIYIIYIYSNLTGRAENGYIAEQSRQASFR